MKISLRKKAKRTGVFDSIPDEVLIRIFRHLGLEDTASVALTCRRFYSIVYDKVLWKGYLQRDFVEVEVSSPASESELHPFEDYRNHFISLKDTLLERKQTQLRTVRNSFDRFMLQWTLPTLLLLFCFFGVIFLSLHLDNKILNDWPLSVVLVPFWLFPLSHVIFVAFYWKRYCFDWFDPIPYGQLMHFFHSRVLPYLMCILPAMRYNGVLANLSYASLYGAHWGLMVLYSLWSLVVRRTDRLTSTQKEGITLSHLVYCLESVLLFFHELMFALYMDGHFNTFHKALIPVYLLLFIYFATLVGILISEYFNTRHNDDTDFGGVCWFIALCFIFFFLPLLFTTVSFAEKIDGINIGWVIVFLPLMVVLLLILLSVFPYYVSALCAKAFHLHQAIHMYNFQGTSESVRKWSSLNFILNPHMDLDMGEGEGAETADDDDDDDDAWPTSDSDLEANPLEHTLDPSPDPGQGQDPPVAAGAAQGEVRNIDDQNDDDNTVNLNVTDDVHVNNNSGSGSNNNTNNSNNTNDDTGTFEGDIEMEPVASAPPHQEPQGEGAVASNAEREVRQRAFFLKGASFSLFGVIIALFTLLFVLG